MEKFQFQKAQAVWVSGREREKNCELAFRALLSEGNAFLYLAASTIYRLRINGKFVCAGPARAAHGYYCVDRIELTDYLTEETNVVVIEVVGYNVSTYDTLNQPAFLTAEIVRNGEVICCTGDAAVCGQRQAGEPGEIPSGRAESDEVCGQDRSSRELLSGRAERDGLCGQGRGGNSCEVPSGRAECAAAQEQSWFGGCCETPSGRAEECRIRAYDLGQRVRKVQRYSFQRAFAECYDLQAEKAEFYTRSDWEKLAAYERPTVIAAGENVYLKRSVRMPAYERLQVQALVETGQVDFLPVLPGALERWETKEGMTGYAREEQEVHLVDEVRSFSLIPGESPQLRFSSHAVIGFKPEEEGSVESVSSEEEPCDKKETAPQSCFPICLRNAYALFCFPFNATGFPRMEIKCEEPCTVYFLFDEILEDGKLDCMRMASVNCFRYTLDPGFHTVMAFAPYTMKYAQVIVKGQAAIEHMDMIEYKHPSPAYRVRLPEDAAPVRICQAAEESWRSNAVDIFTDCPSRERAGWLCDSFFTARVEYVLTGESVLEKAFLENFLLPERFAYLPEGMLPMCYPADHPDGNFIPNWAMWFVLELEEYLDRSGDRDLIDRARERVYALAAYFQGFENEYGLLEGLESWVFVEWSRANDPDVVQDVNFPTNMLYMRMLLAMFSLYGDESLREKATRLRKVIRERSFDGSFFTDNERRENGRLINPGNRTEVCQYYAFFTGAADRETDAGLWEVLNRDFGPQRKSTGKYQEVAFANAFIGNYLRIELLYRNGQYEDVLENIRGYFAAMAERTGTLWEFDSPTASCNHGFASHVIYWLAGIYGVEKKQENEEAVGE